MDSIINLGIPHVGEQIFKSLNNGDLIECLKVSQTWKVLAETVLFPRWKGKLLRACKQGHPEIVKMLLDCSPRSEINVNKRKDEEYRRTALMWACIGGHTEVVKLLLKYPFKGKRRIDLNVKDDAGKTALMCRGIFSRTPAQILGFGALRCLLVRGCVILTGDF